MIISCFLLLLAASFLSAGLVLQPQNRIINGRDMDIEEAPWQVSLQVNGEHHCGGSIYSDRIIITAAHCLYINYRLTKYKYLTRLLHAKEILVIAGSEFKRSRKTLAAVSAIKHFEKYIHGITNSTYDIGILKISKPLPVSKQIRPIPLAVENPAPGSEVLSTGWGRLMSPVSADISSEILQGINISIENFDWCKNSLTEIWIKYDTICAGTAGHSSCHGDSGGPLVFNNTLVGVVSGGSGICVGPGIYTSVAHYHKWLLNAIKLI